MLERLLGSDTAQVGVARLDLKRLAGGPMRDAAPPRFKELLAAARGTGGGQKRQDRELLQSLERATTPAEREKLLLVALVLEMSRVLGVPSDRFEVDRPLSELGMDSLMTVELINWVEESLDFRLPTVELMKNPTTADMARLLLDFYNKKRAEPETAQPSVTVDAGVQQQQPVAVAAS